VKRNNIISIVHTKPLEDTPIHTFRNTALQTRIKRIATEQRHQLRLARILLIRARIRIAQCLEPCNAADGFARAGLDVVDVVVVKNAQVGRGGVRAVAGVGDALCGLVLVLCSCWWCDVWREVEQFVHGNLTG
jgi:hypothetical protein